MRTFWWDFFGPDARGTAEHFKKHTDQFLGREGLTGCTTGVTEQAGAWSAWCACPAQWEEPIRKALRPKRESDGA